MEPVLLERVRVARLALDHQWLRGYRGYKAEAGSNGTFNGPTDLSAAVEDFLTRATASAGSNTIRVFGCEDYGYAMRRRAALIAKPPALPTELAQYGPDEVIDVQDFEFMLVRKGAEWVEDPAASDGWASRMDPAVTSWLAQLRNIPPAVKSAGRWRVYANVRCENATDSGVAFQCGIVGGGKTLTIRLDDREGALVTSGQSPNDGRYHLYDLGTYEGKGYVWFGTTGVNKTKNVRAIYIDRVLFVKG
jgi:hypothetical protein